MRRDLLLLSLGLGCAPDGTLGLICRNDAHCDPGQVCRQGECVWEDDIETGALESVGLGTSAVSTTVGSEESTTTEGTSDDGPTPSCPQVPSSGTSPAVWLAGASGFHTCAVLVDRRVKCWGSNLWGQLGQGSAAFAIGDLPGSMGANLRQIQLGPETLVERAALGRHHSCAVMLTPPTAALSGSRLRCFGSNESGELGLGSAVASWGTNVSQMQNLPEIALGEGVIAEAVTLGVEFTCALVSDGRVKCWGRNDEGQLGYEDTLFRGATPATAPDQIAYVDLGVGFVAEHINAGSYHVCAIAEDGAEVKCWGNNAAGQLGQGDDVNRGDEVDTMGDMLEPIDLGSTEPVLALTSGGAHSCALLGDGSIRCWGSNDRGQLGLGISDLRVGDDADETGAGLEAVNLAGADAVQIVAGERHTCARLDDGDVKCWGNNAQGQLGVGSIEDVGKRAEDMGIALESVELGGGRSATWITAGESHSCAVLDDGSLKCWGGNVSGQLGLEDSAARGTDPCSVGDYLPAVRL